MKQYQIRKLLFVFLSTAVIVSCHKEKDPVSISANNGNATSPPNNINSDSSVVRGNATSPPSNNKDSSLVSGTDNVFYFLKSSTYPIICYSTYCTVRSRFIFQNDGSFVLQYDRDGENEYRSVITYKGRYSKTNNGFSFTWEGWSVAGPWGAAGSLTGDTLTVEYNTIMGLSDFDDAVYLRKR